MNGFNGYDLSRRFWDWAFRVQENRNPTHSALYAWFVEYANRCGWPENFAMAPQYAMTAIGVNSYNNYKKILADLVGVGFVRVIRSGQNQYAPALIALSKNDIALNFDYVIPKSGDLSNAMSKNDKAKGFATSRAISKNDIAQKTADDDSESAMSQALSKNDEAHDIAHDIARDAITINSKTINLNLNKTERANARPLFWSVLEISFADWQKWHSAYKKKDWVRFPPNWSPSMIDLYKKKWLTFRQKKFRARLLAESIQMQIDKMADFNESQLAACIDNSISNSYQGLFPEKFATNGNKATSTVNPAGPKIPVAVPTTDRTTRTGFNRKVTG